MVCHSTTIRISDRTLNFNTLAAYAIVVRGSEYDLPPEMLDDIVSLSVSTYGNRGRQHKKGGKDALTGHDNDYEDD